MRRLLRILAWIMGVLVLLPVFVVLAAVLFLNTNPGRREVEHLAAQLTGGQVVLAGLSGRFPDALRLRHAEVHDSQGAWLVLDDVVLDWSPLALLHREALVDTLSAGLVQVPRLPVPAPNQPPAPSSGGSFSLPVQVTVRALHIARAEIGAPVAGVAAVLAADGKAHLASLQDGSADVTIDRLDSPGSYAVHGAIDPAHLDATVTVREPPHGLIAAIAKLPDIGAIALDAKVAGPRDAEATALDLTAGPLKAAAKGTVNITGQAADLDVTASAPAMTPAPGVSWQTIALTAHVHGPFTRPDAAGKLQVTGLAAGGAAIASLAADLHGNQGAAGLTATVNGLRIPGPKPDLFAAAPLTLQADARLDAPARPVTFTLAHPLLQASGHADTGGAISAHVDLTAPDLQPLAAAGGVDLQGQTKLAVDAAIAGGTTTVKLDGTVGITGGLAPVPALLGSNAQLGVTAALAGGDITVSRAEIAGKALRVSASGTDRSNVLDLAYDVALPQLAALAPTAEGGVEVKGTAKGKTGDLAVDAALTGTAGTKGFPPGPVQVAVHATGLPGNPSGSVTAQGTLQGAPLHLAADAQRGADGVLHATIHQADWKSLHAEGAVTLPKGAALPDGSVKLRLGQLADLQPFVHQALTGSVTADAALMGGTATVNLDASHAGIPGSSVGSAVLKARVTDPTTHPTVAATLDASGIEAGGISGSAKLAVNGPEDALGIRLNADLANLSGAPATAAATATLDVPRKTVALTAFTADWKGEAVRLLGPAHVSFGDGVAVDRLAAGLGGAVLDLSGRVSPALNLTASLRGVTPALAKPFAPTLDAAGEISAEARLQGTPAAPTGTVRLNAAGMRLLSGPARGLPPANLTATAELAGHAANVNARLTAGSANLSVSGRAPLGAGALALRANGGVDLRLLDPILLAQGREARGTLRLDASIGGTTAAPQLAGTAVLAGGEITDFAQGVHLTALNATIAGSGESVRIQSLTGRAGTGTISAGGSVGLTGAMPVDLTVTMRNAQPLASDRLTATLNADLALRGALQSELAASGRIAIVNATINIPEHLPGSVAVLPVRIAGAPPAPPAKPAAVVRLDLSLSTPGQIVVRGRGLYATLGGALHVGGTTAAPQVTGAFDMKRGTFSVAGTTLTFSRGRVGFEGAGVTNKIDPSLDFEADAQTTSGTASLIVGGYASAPKITLTSSPPLPQDEILAQLLFGRSAAQLGPFQYAEIAAALAQISGAGGGAFSALDKLRNGLGLDRLNVGGGTGANGSNNGASIEAGKYIANGVFLGAKQGTSGAGTQAEVQVDLYKGLKLETDVGTGSGGNSVGLSYQFNY